MSNTLAHTCPTMPCIRLVMVKWMDNDHGYNCIHSPPQEACMHKTYSTFFSHSVHKIRGRFDHQNWQKKPE